MNQVSRPANKPAPAVAAAGQSRHEKPVVGRGRTQTSQAAQAAQAVVPTTKAAAKPSPAQLPPVQGHDLVDEVREGIPIAISMLSWAMVGLAAVFLSMSLLMGAATWIVSTQQIELWAMTSSGHMFRVQQMPQPTAERVLAAPAARRVVESAR